MNVAANSIARNALQGSVEMVEGEFLAFDPRQTRVFYLNASAAVIWGLCDGVRRAEDICRMIEQAYPDDSPDLLNDVITTIAQLEECGLLELL